MPVPPEKPSLNHQVNRYFARDDAPLATDPYGFLLDRELTDSGVSIVGAEALVAPGFTIITAPPWSGKTFVAQNLCDYQRDRAEAGYLFEFIAEESRGT